MKKIVIAAIAFGSSLFLVGCTNTDKEIKTAVTGY